MKRCSLNFIISILLFIGASSALPALAASPTALPPEEVSFRKKIDGLCELAMNEQDEHAFAAEAHLKEAIGLIRSNVDHLNVSALKNAVWMQLLQMYEKQNRFSKAEQIYKERGTKFWKRPQLDYKLAKFFMSEGNYAFARVILRNCVPLEIPPSPGGFCGNPYMEYSSKINLLKQCEVKTQGMTEDQLKQAKSKVLAEYYAADPSALSSNINQVQTDETRTFGDFERDKEVYKPLSGLSHPVYGGSNSNSIRDACRQSSSIVLAEYYGFDKRPNVGFWDPPIAHFRIIQSLHGPVLPNDLKVAYEFYDFGTRKEPQDWKYSDELLPEKGSKFILCIMSFSLEPGVFKTYNGAYGRIALNATNLKDVRQEILFTDKLHKDYQEGLSKNRH